jgi:hypothetical protein
MNLAMGILASLNTEEDPEESINYVGDIEQQAPEVVAQTERRIDAEDRRGNMSRDRLSEPSSRI